MEEYIEYEVYANSIHGSDVTTFDTLEEAEAHAIAWSMESIDVDIVIERVKRVVFKKFRNGGRVA